MTMLKVFERSDLSCFSRQLKNRNHTVHRSDYMEGKGKYTGMSKIDAKIRLEYFDETFILRRIYFFKML